MKVITYNVWFDLRDYKPRITEICNIIKTNDPDFVCLQEVTKEILIIIREQLPNYYVSREVSEGYNTVILSKHKVDDIITIPFKETNMGRNMHFIEVQINGDVHTIVTTHLESEIEGDLRFTQISEVFDKFAGQGNVIIAGDMNFKETIEPHSFKDSWLLKGTEENRYTFDYTLNHNILGFTKERFDRVFVSNDIKVKEFMLIGTEPTVMGCPPSDHFGVLVEF